ncbi:uncharacterized protein LOC142590229 [Dermacentor variabilis]|uniref:uncharacterized protein LOC142590229 n=1 Tax=Dermacentor variabilis TaxID=34621 RepID=UPI003F5C7A6E
MKITMSSHHCWAVNCKNSLDKNPRLQFFNFPTDRTLSRQWCINSGRGHLSGCDRRALLRRGAVLCEKHFKQSQFMTLRQGNEVNKPKQLLWNAIPTLFPLPLRSEENVSEASESSAALRKLSNPPSQEAESGGEENLANPGERVNVEDYEMAALPTFGRERLLGIAKKQWHEIKRLRVNVRNLERGLASNLVMDETYLLDLLQRNLDGPLLDRVVEIIVGDVDDDNCPVAVDT